MNRTRPTKRRPRSLDPAHPWALGSCVFSRQYGIGRIRFAEWLTSGNAKSSLLVYLVRFAGRTDLVDVASPMLHLLGPPIWADSSLSSDGDQGGFAPPVLDAPQRARKLNEQLLRVIEPGSPPSNLWQIVVAEVAGGRLGPTRAQLRFLQKGRSTYMYELRPFEPALFKEGENVTIHAELATRSGVVLSTFPRGGVVGFSLSLGAPTSRRFDVG